MEQRHLRDCKQEVLLLCGDKGIAINYHIEQVQRMLTLGFCCKSIINFLLTRIDSMSWLLIVLRAMPSVIAFDICYR